MIVQVLLFASYAEALGADTVAVDVAAPARLADVVAAIRQRPGGERVPPTPLVARNQAYATLEDLVAAGDEIALIPPVAGG